MELVQMHSTNNTAEDSFHATALDAAKILNFQIIELEKDTTNMHLDVFQTVDCTVSRKLDVKFASAFWEQDPTMETDHLALDSFHAEQMIAVLFSKFPSPLVKDSSNIQVNALHQLVDDFVFLREVDAKDVTIHWEVDQMLKMSLSAIGSEDKNNFFFLTF